MIKRSISIILCLLLTCSLFVGCSSKKDDEGFDIICTVFPIYDWVRQCLKDIDGVSVALLVDNGTDPHSYNATAEDIATITSCDMMIYVGGESDKWVETALSNATKPTPTTLRLLDMMENRAHGEHGHGEICEEEHDHSIGAYDEHVWLSLKNASMLTARISERIASCLPEKADKIKENTNAYVAEINALDTELSTTVSGAERRTLLFADRFPFGYLIEDYELEYYAAFSGCSADSEASFATVISLTQKLNELDLPCVLVLESSDKKLADTVISGSESTNVKILTLDSMQSITEKDIADGSVKYIEIMKRNASVLKEALGAKG